MIVLEAAERSRDLWRRARSKPSRPHTHPLDASRCPCLSKISTPDFVVTDSAGQMLAYVYFEVELGGDRRRYSRKVSCLVVR
jgi:hypothetical protein